MISQGSSSPAGAVSAQTVTDLQTQIRALKNEQVGLKEQLSKLRQESSRHQARADEAEKQAAESARQAKSAKENCFVQHLEVSCGKNRIDPICENCVVRHDLSDCVNRP
jgi:septal ring factor EnvC (AmiA/AmiB activator)